MKTEKNIFIAFLLNFAFSIFEFGGGIYTGSVAVISDAVHDMGDALSIGISYFLERKSKKQPDENYTYGYMRFSVMGSLITTIILLVGSVSVIANAVSRLFHPVPIHYSGMILFAVIGLLVNLVAAWFTKDGDSLNQKAVNLHMLEDVLGWALVLIGAIVMRFTDFSVIDPLMSIAVSVFILINAGKNIKEVLYLFLEKRPQNIDMEEIKAHIRKIEGIKELHHIHIRSINGYDYDLTMHVVADGDSSRIKKAIRETLEAHHIGHATLELESPGEVCEDTSCSIRNGENHAHHHHHHHHHH